LNGTGLAYIRARTGYRIRQALSNNVIVGLEIGNSSGVAS